MQQTQKYDDLHKNWANHCGNCVIISFKRCLQKSLEDRTGLIETFAFSLSGLLRDV